jgi:hypothetical protein
METARLLGTSTPWMGMAGVTALVAGFSYPITVLVGYPVLYLLVKRSEKRWWVYVGASFAIGLVVSLLFGPLAGFVLMVAALNGLAFWLIGVKANPRFNADVQQASLPHAGQPQR